MPSSEGANIVRSQGPRARAALAQAIHALLLSALVTALALAISSDVAFGGEDRAMATIALRPAAARLLAEARGAPVVAEGAGFTLTARATPKSHGRSRAPSRRVTARLPRDAAGPITVGVVGEGHRALVRRAFAGAASGRLADGALVYTDAAPGVDAVWFARGDDAEELLVVRAGAVAIAYDLELPAGSTLTAPPGFPGLVEVRDAGGEAWLRMTANAAWDARGQPVPIAVRADASRVWIDVPASAERPVVVDPTWSGAGRLAFGRAGHTATLLGTGRVLIAGGYDDAFIAVGQQEQVKPEKGATAELYNPATGRFTATSSPMSEARAQHSATMLRDGRVLLQGGLETDDTTAVVGELFDPTKGQFTSAGKAESSALHTATMLQDGRVLLIGGAPATEPRSAEIYTGKGFLAVATPTTQERLHHTATPLPDGRVLLAGGDGAPSGRSFELFEPASSSFVAGAGELAVPRREHTATLLRDGRVLIAGGYGGKGDPVSKTAELFDPATGQSTADMPMMTVARASHTATLLPSGKVLLVGGVGAAGETSEIFNPTQPAFSEAQELLHPRYGGQTATLLPSGAVLIAGGRAEENSKLLTAEVEIFDPLDDAYTATASAMVATHIHHTATRLIDGRVLVFGGLPSANDVPVAELYERRVDGFVVAGFSGGAANRSNHTATRLPSGRVLIAGGSTTDAKNTALSTAILYAPDLDKFIEEHPMGFQRDSHTATLLSTGQVLLAGGFGEGGSATATCELYDPKTRMFSPTKGQMATRRALHTATLLPSGEVLILGGTSSVASSSGSADDLSNAELYDPRTEKFRPTGSLVGASPPVGPSTATLLPSGEVLILGKGTPELYDPASGEFRVNVNASGYAPRLAGQTATLLPSGRVLIAGGTIDDKLIPWPMIYTPATGELETPLATEEGTVRALASATLLTSGEVLITGGERSSVHKLSTARRWTEAPNAAFRPQITEVNGAMEGDGVVTIRGDWGARGSDTTGGSSNSSASNHPLAIWMPWGGGAALGNTKEWSLDAAKWTVPHGGFVGQGLLFVSSGGVTSAGLELTILPGLPCTSNLECNEGEVCSAEGQCVPPLHSGDPAGACAIGRAATAGVPPGIALLLGLAIAAVRRAARARPTSPGRAGGCWRRRRARRAPARRRA